jgi:mRNA interferase MazF
LDPTEGREQAGNRPAIVVSPTFINERSELLIVLPITSKKVDRVHPFEVLLDHEACGLPRPSKALANQVRAIDKRRVAGLHGIADERTLHDINAVLQLTLGLVAF